MRELEILETATNGIVEHLSPFMAKHHDELSRMVRDGLLEVIELGYYENRYRVTEKGRDFIKQHAAPAEW